MVELRTAWPVAVALAGLVAGALLWWAASPMAPWAWTVATIPVLALLVVEIVQSLRSGNVGLDLVAALSMSAALAFGEPLAGNVVALMYAGGQLLEAFAQGRARREMTALLRRAPRTAMLHENGTLVSVPVERVVPGDRLLIRKGEVLPVDGRVAGTAVLDASALTGESMPEVVPADGQALSGTMSVGPAFDLIATRPAAESTFARIVKLVETAQQSKAPMVRLADRYALVFLVATLLLAGGAWLISGERVRALAVLVSATPCPLILAVPVALISGLSRAAKSGVLIKDGGVLEALARVRTAIFDKTGTLTHGRVSVQQVITLNGFEADEVLRLAASLDLASAHVVAAALIADSLRRGLELATPTNVEETAGDGLEGDVGGQRVAIGSRGYVARRLDRPDEAVAGGNVDGMAVHVAVDGRPAGVILLEDRVRHDAADAIARFRGSGIRKIVLASGDRRNVAAAVGRELGVDDAFGEITPAQKVDLVVREAAAAPVQMIGDGVNDAPALAAADVGVAMGARGSAASAESAGVVLLVDGLAPLATALGIAQRTRRIAIESVLVGLGLSGLAMFAAAFGYLPPVQGALVQEGIDVAVILNALRALR